MNLDLDSLPQMKIADYIGLFKDKTTWRKANFILLLSEYEMGGKKVSIALPFKLASDAKAAFKRLKQEKIHEARKSGLGRISIEKTKEGEKAKMELFDGGLPDKMLQKKGEKLFEKMQWAFEVVLGAVPADDEVPPVKNIAPEKEQPSEKTSNTDKTKELASLADKCKLALQAFKSELLPNFKNKVWDANSQSKLEAMQQLFQQFLQPLAGLSSIAPVFLALKTTLDGLLPNIAAMLKAGAAKTSTNPLEKELSEASAAIYAGMKNAKEVILVNLKNQKSTEQDLQSVQTLMQQIQAFLQKGNANTELKPKFEKQLTDALSFGNSLKTLAANIQQQLQTTTPKNTAKTSKEQIQSRVQQIKARIAEIQKALAV